MAVSVFVNGVNRTAYWSLASATIEKDYAVEQMSATFRDEEFSALAYRVYAGDVLRVLHDSDLLFGGPVQSVREKRLEDEGPIAMDVEARGWESLAESIIVSSLETSYKDAIELGYALFVYHLQPKGCTWIGATTGGPTIPPFSFNHTRLSDIYAEIRRLSNLSLRINGDKQAAMVEPGAIAAPVAISGAVPLLGLNFTKHRRDIATQVFVQTGVPESGPGPVSHSETHTANGVKTSFPVNVEAARRYGAVNHEGGYAAGATTMAIDGMFPSVSLIAGDTFRVAGHGSVDYEVTAGATSNSEGAFGAVAFTPALGSDVADDAVVTFDARTFVRLTVGGVATSLITPPWSFNTTLQVLTTTDVAPGSGVPVVYTTPVLFPAWVRAWDASIQNADGTLDAAAIVDTVTQASMISDLRWAKGHADYIIEQRHAEPCNLSATIREKGVYPLQSIVVNLPEHNLSGSFIVERVRVSMVENDVRYALECIEGGEHGRLWDELFREMWAGGSAGGSAAVAAGGASSGSSTSGSSSTAALPAGTTFHVGGSNGQTFTATTAWASVPEAIPTQLGGPGMAGGWVLRVPCYQLAAGTMEVRLLDQTTSGVLATCTTTATGSYVDVSFYAYTTASFTAPTAVDDVLLQVRVTAGSRDVVVGHATVVKA